jgi:MazG family protein
MMHTLRSPGGCPWDAEQTHESLLKYLREESEEVVHAVRAGDWDNLKDELGDVLLQVLFHAELAAESGRFDINDVFEALKSKLIRRHPHVFGLGKKEKLTPAEVARRWKIIKDQEKKSRK